MSFHRDVPAIAENDEAASDDEKQDFSFEEAAIDGANENSIEEEEKSLINALSFKRQIPPIDRGSRQTAWATNAKNQTTSEENSSNLQR